MTKSKGKTITVLASICTMPNAIYSLSGSLRLLLHRFHRKQTAKLTPVKSQQAATQDEVHSGFYVNYYTLTFTRHINIK